MFKFISKALFLFTLAITFNKTFSAPKPDDLYANLGLQKNASPEQIKKNFRKLAKKFHPDANKNRQNWAEKEFIKVNKAYEILSDPEKRKLYDMGGEEAVNNQAQGRAQNGQGFQGGSMEDIINMMFGGGGRRAGFGAGGFNQGHQQRGGFQFNSEQNNRRHRRQPNMDDENEQPKQAEKVNFLDISLAIILDESNAPDFSNLQENWNVFFYNEESKNTPQAKWVKNFIEKFGMHLKIAVVDCSKSQILCNQQKVFKFPEYYIFYSQNRRIKIDLIDGLPLEFMVQQNIDLMEKNVIRVTSENYNEFIKKHFSKPIVLSFTERKNTSILLLSLAQLLKDKVVFGEILKGDLLNHKFQIGSYPTIILVDDPLSFSKTVFTGSVKRETILYWIQDKALNRKATSQQQVVKELNKERIRLGNCGDTDTSLCFIAVVKKNEDLNRFTTVLSSLNEKFASDGFSFYYIQQSKLNYAEFVKTFGNFSTVVIRGKRKRFSGFEESVLQKSDKEMNSWMENLISGSGSPMKNYKSIDVLAV